MEDCSVSSELANIKVHGPLTQSELEREPDFAKLQVDILDPILEPLRRKRPHIADEHHVQELADSLALLLAEGMHLHAFIESKMNTPLLLPDKIDN